MLSQGSCHTWQRQASGAADEMLLCLGDLVQGCHEEPTHVHRNACQVLDHLFWHADTVQSVTGLAYPLYKQLAAVCF